MAVLANIISLLVLLNGVCLPEIQASRSGSHSMLDQIATDVVADVFSVVRYLIQNKVTTDGPPSVPSIYTSFSIAGIEFTLEAGRGVFKGFPSLRIVERTELTYRLNDNNHIINLQIPISFENYMIRFENVTAKAGDAIREGNMTVKAKTNEFLVGFTVTHRHNKCTMSLNGVTALHYTDVDFEFELEGMPHLHLTNISNSITRTSDDYESYVLEELFDFYLSPQDVDNNNTRHSVFAYCTYQPRPSEYHYPNPQLQNSHPDTKKQALRHRRSGKIGKKFHPQHRKSNL